MSSILKARLVKIGNSHGVRIPKVWLNQLALSDEVEMAVQADHIVIRSAHRPRQGWETRFAAMTAAGDDAPLDITTAPTPSAWDDTEWQW